VQLRHDNATAGTEGAAVWRSRWQRGCCAQRDAVNLRQGRVKGKGEGGGGEGGCVTQSREGTGGGWRALRMCTARA
jgi:hypothetical protein